MTMHEIDEAAKTITDAVDPDANIIFGAVLDENMEDDLQITVVATGFDATHKQASQRQPIVREREEQPVPVRPAAQAPTYRPEPRQSPAPQYRPEPVMAMPEPEREPEPEPEPEPYVPPVMNTSRKPFIDERPQVEPEPDVVPIQMPTYEPAPPRRFPSLNSIEPADNEDDELVEEGPKKEPKIEMDSLSSSKISMDASDMGLPTDDDDLDVPAFIRRKVD